MTLRLNGDTSGFTEIKAANAAGDNSIKLPAANGSANQLLQNGGTAGELQYTSANGGLHYDSSGRLLVGRSSAPDNDGALIIQGYAGVTAGEGTIQLLRGNNVTTTTQGLGTIDFGHDQYLGASIDALSAAGWTEGVSHPTKLTFSTTATGSVSPTPRIELANTGELKLLAGCPGIDFSAIQTNASGMTSETLDSYEEGSWTPTINKSGTTGSITGYTDRFGFYRRVGNLLWVSFYVYKNAGTFGTGTNQWYISGLPFGLSTLTSSAYAFIPGGYLSINGTSYGFSGDVAAGHRFQANNVNGAATLSLYGVEHNTNWTSSVIEMSGCGVLMLA
jgi:hypothetical protein